jgi:serine protease Do
MRSLLAILPLSSALCFVPRAAAQYTVPRELMIALQARGMGSYLGLRLVDIDMDRAKVLKLADVRGAEVVSVVDDSPAQEAGLKPGDVLLTYNGENIMGAQQLGRLVAETPRNRRIAVQYWRDGKTNTAMVTTAAAPLVTWPESMPQGDVHVFVSEFPIPLMSWRNPILGLECEGVDAQLAQYFGVKRGILVRAVDKGSAADKSGIRAGDIMTMINDRAVSSPRDLGAYMRSERNPLASLLVEVTRDKKPMTLKIVLETQP